MSNSVTDDIILEVKDLKMHFPITAGIFRRKVGEIKAVDGVSFKIKTRPNAGTGRRKRLR